MLPVRKTPECPWASSCAVRHRRFIPPRPENYLRACWIRCSKARHARAQPSMMPWPTWKVRTRSSLFLKGKGRRTDRNHQEKGIDRTFGTPRRPPKLLHLWPPLGTHTPGDLSRSLTYFDKRTNQSRRRKCDRRCNSCLSPYFGCCWHKACFILVSISTSKRYRATLRRPFSRVSLMHAGKLVFAQLTEYLPLTTFRRCVALYSGECDRGKSPRGLRLW